MLVQANAGLDSSDDDMQMDENINRGKQHRKRLVPVIKAFKKRLVDMDQAHALIVVGCNVQSALTFFYRHFFYLP